MKTYEEILRTSLEPVKDTLLNAGPQTYLVACALVSVFHEDAAKLDVLYAYIRSRKRAMPAFASNDQFMVMMARGEAVGIGASLTALMTASSEIQRLENDFGHWLLASRGWASWEQWFRTIAEHGRSEEARRIAVVACSVFDHEKGQVSPDPYLATMMFSALVSRMEPKAQDGFYRLLFKNLMDTEAAHDERARLAR